MDRMSILTRVARPAAPARITTTNKTATKTKKAEVKPKPVPKKAAKSAPPQTRRSFGEYCTDQYSRYIDLRTQLGTGKPLWVHQVAGAWKLHCCLKTGKF